jgi:hypothetical protein
LAARIVNSEGEQVMTTTEQPSLDQTGTWEPDWDALEQVHKFHIVVNARQRSEIIIEEYRRQQAAQGLVEVRREALETVLDRAENFGDYTQIHTDQSILHQDHIRSVLAAAKDQNR